MAGLWLIIIVVGVIALIFGIMQSSSAKKSTVHNQNQKLSPVTANAIQKSQESQENTDYETAFLNLKETLSSLEKESKRTNRLALLAEMIEVAQEWNKPSPLHEAFRLGNPYFSGNDFRPETETPYYERWAMGIVSYIEYLDEHELTSEADEASDSLRNMFNGIAESHREKSEILSYCYGVACCRRGDYYRLNKSRTTEFWNATKEYEEAIRAFEKVNDWSFSSPYTLNYYIDTISNLYYVKDCAGGNNDSLEMLDTKCAYFESIAEQEFVTEYSATLQNLRIHAYIQYKPVSAAYEIAKEHFERLQNHDWQSDIFAYYEKLECLDRLIFATLQSKNLIAAKAYIDAYKSYETLYGEDFEANPSYKINLRALSHIMDADYLVSSGENSSVVWEHCAKAINVFRDISINADNIEDDIIQSYRYVVESTMQILPEFLQYPNLYETLKKSYAILTEKYPFDRQLKIQSCCFELENLMSIKDDTSKDEIRLLLETLIPLMNPAPQHALTVGYRAARIVNNETIARQYQTELHRRGLTVDE